MFGYGLTVPVIHEGLERGGRVAEAKHHNTRLVETSARLKRCLVSVGLLDPDIVVSLPYIELGVESCTTQIPDEITDERQGVLITNRVAVDGAIVLHWSEFSIFLFDEEK